MSIANPVKPYNFANGTTADATQVNSDFDTLYSKAVEIIAQLNAATHFNTVSTLVARDASGNFAAGTITANSFVGTLNGTKVYKGALVYNTAGGTATLSFAAESYDTDSIHDNSTNPSRLTVPSGITKIRLIGQAHVTTSSSGVLFIQKNGGTSYVGFAAEGTVANTTTNIITPVITVSAGDYFELVISGATVQADAAGTNTWFAMEILE